MISGSRRDDISSSSCSSFFYVSSDHDDGIFENPAGDSFIKQNKKEASIGSRFTLNQKRTFKKVYGQDLSYGIKEEIQDITGYLSD